MNFTEKAREGVREGEREIDHSHLMKCPWKDMLPAALS